MAAQYARLGTLTNGRTAQAAYEYLIWWPLFTRLVRLKYAAQLEIIQALGLGKFSSGTHAAPGASLDLRTWRFILSVTLGIVRLAREAGASATWYRTRAQGFDPHVHLVLNIPRWSPALYQEIAVKLGYNGLGRGGMARRDDGPRPSQWRTAAQGIVWMRNQITALEGGGTPSLPSTGDGYTRPTDLGGLTMADINTIMAQLALIKAQNKQIVDEVQATPRKIWGWPVKRTVNGKLVNVSALQELADTKTMVAKLK